jgi:hypothetical protein
MIGMRAVRMMMSFLMGSLRYLRQCVCVCGGGVGFEEGEQLTSVCVCEACGCKLWMRRAIKQAVNNTHEKQTVQRTQPPPAASFRDAACLYL